MMCNSKVIGKPLLLLTNKQDCVAVCSNTQIWEALNVKHVMGSLAQMVVFFVHVYHLIFSFPFVQRKCSAMCRGFRGKGNPSIVKGLKWLMRCVHFHYSELSSRIENDVAIQLAEQKQKKAAKLQGIEM